MKEVYEVVGVFANLVAVDVMWPVWRLFSFFLAVAESAGYPCVGDTER